VAEDQTAQYDIFVDESGNTGPDLLSSDQPAFVWGMVAVPRSFDCADLVRGLREEFAPQAGPELKCVNLVKWDVGRALLAAAATRLVGKAHLFLGVVEKRYFLAALALEAFFDASRNRLAPPGLASVALRRRLCNVLCDCVDDATMALLAAAAREKSITMLAEAGGRIASRVALHPADEVARWAPALFAGGNDPCPLWSTGRFRGVLLPRPNPAMRFVPTLQAIARFLDASSSRGRLICDVEMTNDPSLAIAFDLVRDPRSFTNGVTEYGTRGPMSMFTERVSADSRDEPGIQLADFAAGLASRLVRAAIRGDRLREVLEAWQPYNELLRAGQSWWEVRDSLLPALREAFAGNLPPPG
jgi:hypothetical protein